MAPDRSLSKLPDSEAADLALDSLHGLTETQINQVLGRLCSPAPAAVIAAVDAVKARTI